MLQSWLLSGFLFIWIGVDLWIYLQLSQSVSLGGIFTMCCLTGGFGVWIVQKEGLSLWTDFESELQNQRMPAPEFIDAVLVLLSGLCFVMPGLLSDALAFLLLMPAIRQWATPIIREHLKKRIRG